MSTKNFLANSAVITAMLAATSISSAQTPPAHWWDRFLPTSLVTSPATSLVTSPVTSRAQQNAPAVVVRLPAKPVREKESLAQHSPPVQPLPAPQNAFTPPRPSPQAQTPSSSSNGLDSPTVPQFKTFKGTDISDLIAYFRPLVKTITRETYVYNWRDVSNVNYFHQALTLHDPQAYRVSTHSAQSYWDNFGGEPGSNVMGYGLYTSFEPAATSSYGGYDHWLMTQFRLPIGFHVVDTTDPDLANFPQAIQDKIATFNCDASSLQSLLNANEVNGNDDCAGLVKAIFQNNLRMDGLIYSFYGASQLCTDSPTAPWHEQAMVLTSNWWMTPDSVETYFPNMIGAETERAQMLDLFSGAGLIDTHLWTNLPTKFQALDKAWQSQHFIGCGDNLPFK